MFIRESIIINIDKDKYFLPFCTLSFCSRREKIQNILWFVCGITLPESVEYLSFPFGLNNVGLKRHLKDAKGLENVATTLKKNYKDLHIFISYLLPRDNIKSVNRWPLYAVNNYLSEYYTNKFIIRILILVLLWGIISTLKFS